MQIKICASNGSSAESVSVCVKSSLLPVQAREVQLQPGTTAIGGDCAAVNESSNKVPNWVRAFLNGLKGGIMALNLHLSQL